MRHVNIPLFIPHLGCPNMCVFCNQKIISGTENFDPETVRRDIEKALSTVDTSSCETEIAFFGGSFTGIDRGLMISLLDFAESRIAEQYDEAELDVSFPAKPIYLKRGYQAVSWHSIETENGDHLCFDHMTKHLRNHITGGETHDT